MPRALWLINEERTARNLPPLHGIEENVTAVAQAYAEWLLANNKFGHTADGRTPKQRLYANATINACHDELGVDENLCVGRDHEQRWHRHALGKGDLRLVVR